MRHQHLITMTLKDILDACAEWANVHSDLNVDRQFTAEDIELTITHETTSACHSIKLVPDVDCDDKLVVAAQIEWETLQND